MFPGPSPARSSKLMWPKLLEEVNEELSHGGEKGRRAGGGLGRGGVWNGRGD